MIHYNPEKHHDKLALFFDEGKKISNPVLVNNDLLCPNCGAKLELKKKE